MTELATGMVARAQKGDHDAFQEIVELWRRRILGVVARLIGRPDDAEDVAQEVFVRVYLSLDQLREPGQFEPWVYRIATNAAMDYLRRHRRARIRVSDLSEEQLAVVERAIALRGAADVEQQRELRDMAAQVLGVLGPKDRSLLVLKEIEGLSVKEIGAILGIREEAIKVRLFRARQRVLQKLPSGVARRASVQVRACYGTATPAVAPG